MTGVLADLTTEGVAGVLRWRIVSSCIIIAILIAVCWLDFHFNFDRPGLWLLPVCVCVCGLATAELIELLSAKYAKPSSRWAHLGVLGGRVCCAALVNLGLSGQGSQGGGRGWSTEEMIAGLRPKRLQGSLARLGPGFFVYFLRREGS